MRKIVITAVLLFGTAQAQQHVNAAPNNTPSLAAVNTWTASQYFAAIYPTQVNNVYQLAGFPASGTVNGVTYTTQFDVAFHTLASLVDATGVDLVLKLGDGNYSKCSDGELPHATTHTLSIVGSSMNTTTITQTCSIAAPMFRHLPDPNYSSATFVAFQNLSLNSVSNSQGVLEIDGAHRPILEHLNIREVSSGNYPTVEIGKPGLAGSYSFEASVHDVNVNNTPYTSSSAYTSALASITVTGGAVSAVTVTTPGKYPAATATAWVWGTTATSDTPCTTMPTLTPVMSSNGDGTYSLASVTVTSAGAGCGTDINLQIASNPVADYIFDLGNLSDSTFSDVKVTGSANKAGIRLTNHGGNTGVHMHVYPNSPAVIPALFEFDTGAGMQLFDTSCDSQGHYCFDVQNTSGVAKTNIVVNGFDKFWNPISYYGGSSTVHIGFGASGILLRSGLCGNTRTTSDYHEFVNSAGPIALEKLTTYLSVQSDEICDGNKMSLTANSDYTVLTNMPTSSTPGMNIIGMVFKGTSATSFPVVYLHDPNATLPSWNTNGTMLAVNSVSGFSGLLASLYNNGTQEFSVDYGGNTTINGNLSGNNALRGLLNLSNGPIITHNFADAIAALTINQSNASSTGDIVTATNSTGTVFRVSQTGQTVAPATLLKENTSVASAATISPTTAFFHITGTTGISKMTPLTTMDQVVGASKLGGCVDFVTDSAVAFSSGTGVGNFAVSFTSVAQTPYHACYTPSTGLWYVK